MQLSWAITLQISRVKQGTQEGVTRVREGGREGRRKGGEGGREGTRAKPGKQLVDV